MTSILLSMANTCITEYKLVGTNEDVERLYGALKSLASKKRGKWNAELWDCEPKWLGWIAVDLLGKSYNDYDCKGSFDDFGVGEPLADGRSVLEVSISTAWSHSAKLFKELCEKFNLSMNYIAEEPGSEYFVKHDPDKVLTELSYRLEYEDGEEYFDSVSAAVEWLRRDAPYAAIPNCTEVGEVNAWFKEHGFEDCSLIEVDDEDDDDDDDDDDE